jgi:large subunit ribosomal protein L12
MTDTYVYAVLLLHAAREKITEETVERVLAAAGTQPDESRVKALVAALAGIDVSAVLKTARAAPPVVAAVAQTNHEKSEKREAKKEESLSGLDALFGNS